MTYKFKSRATGDLTMLEVTGKQVMEILGKTPGEPGIVTLAQIPDAIAALEAAAVADDARRKAAKEQAEQQRAQAAETGEPIAVPTEDYGSVTLRQRVVPLIEMLRRSADEGKEVIWER